MVREDIVAGIRNALERGQSLEQATGSMIAAGYDPELVQEASRYAHPGSILMGSASPVPYIAPKVQQSNTNQLQQAPVSQFPQQEAEPGFKQLPVQNTVVQKKRGIPGFLIFLIILFLILLGALITFILFGEDILAYLTGD